MSFAILERRAEPGGEAQIDNLPLRVFGGGVAAATATGVLNREMKWG